MGVAAMATMKRRSFAILSEVKLAPSGQASGKGMLGA